MLKKCGIRKALEVMGATAIEIHKGFHDQYGFFKKDGQLYYFSTCDDRWPGLEASLTPDYRPGEIPVMYRTAKDRKDFTGGYNQWDFLKKLHEKGFSLTKFPQTR